MASSSELIILLAQVLGGGALVPSDLATIRRDFHRSLGEIGAQRLSDGEMREITSGVFAGAMVLTLKNGPSLIAQSFILTEPNLVGRAQVVGQVQLLVETETCYLRSAAVLGKSLALERWGLERDRLPGDLQKSLVLPDSPLAATASPLRIKVVGQEDSVDVARAMHEAAAINLPALRDYAPVRSELLALACMHFGGESKPSSSLRVHRDLVIDYAPRSEASQQMREQGVSETDREDQTLRRVWPRQTPHCRLQSSPFGHIFDEVSRQVRAEGATEDASVGGATQTGSAGALQGNRGAYGPWNPITCLDWLVERAPSVFVRLPPEQFTVRKRTGRWVELDPGRLAGLQVGKRLVSAMGARLHVIRQIAVDQAPDRVIAYIRKDAVQRPLKEGDTVHLDPALFPAQDVSGKRF